MSPLFAVHLNDGFLWWPWYVGGFAVLAGMLAVAAYRTTDREIPRIGVLTAVFFVASQAHIPLGGASVHLILNGLLGVVLRHRAPLAITVGLFLQALLFAHGGFLTLGVNGCVIGIPAVAAGLLFPLFRRLPWRNSRFRSACVFAVSAIWLVLAAVALQILVIRLIGLPFEPRDPPPLWIAELWWVQALIVVLSVVIVVVERQLEADPIFHLGLFVGVLTAGATVLLHVGALWVGGRGDFQALAALSLVSHIPVIAIEGVGVGFVVTVLAKAKPEWLGITEEHRAG